MKIAFKISIILLLLGTSCISVRTQQQKQNSDNQIGVTTTKKDLRHIVLFKFKENVTEEEKKAVEVAFAALPSKIDVIKSFEWGVNNSPEGLEKGFTHSFILTFSSEEDRAIYLPHPDHKAFTVLIKPYIDDVLVLDYWTK